MLTACFKGKTAKAFCSSPHILCAMARWWIPKQGVSSMKPSQWSCAPHSYTAEDVVEIQCHGGVVVVREILNLALELGHA